jgi:phenylpropionate dioxygenase-like ring-hydroxylating dioxygenase large terminal subunit
MAERVDRSSLDRTGPVAALSGAYYTDPKIWEREREKIFFRTWQYAGHVSELEKPGSYFTFSILDQDLFCVKGKDGEIRCFYNVCQHRAHQLVQGTGRKHVITCPYHAWAYDLTGGLRAAPNEAAVDGFDKTKVCLTSVRLEDFNGFLLVNLDPDAAPMSVWYGNAAAEIRDYVPQIDKLKPVFWTEVEEKCNWKVSVENYSECYHCTLNHPTFSNGVVDPTRYNILPENKVLRHYAVAAASGSMTYEIDLEDNPHAGDYGSWFLWPMISFQVYPGNVLNTYLWRATAVDRVTAYRGWHSVDGVESPMVEQLAAQDMNTTVAEDVTLVESVQRGLNSRGYRPGPLVIDRNLGVNSEHSIKALYDWYLEALES